MNVPDQWPRDMYKPDENPKRVNNQKEYEAANAEGWSPAYIPRDLPRMIYETTTGKQVVVHTEEQLEKHLANGYQLKPVAIALPPTPSAVAPATHSASSSAIMDALNSLTEEFEQFRVNSQQEIQELREALESKADRKRQNA